MRDLQPDVTEQDVSFDAGSKRLHGTLFRPKGDPVAAVVLNPATGAPHGFYRHFARWLVTDRNMACLTYDYSDFGASATRHPRDSDATMSDWALVDQPAARNAMRDLLPGVPIWVVGHSLGAMLMPLQDGLEDVQRMIGVASGLVRHTDHPWPYQLFARLFWFGHAPMLVKMLGYLPGRVVGFNVDLPSGVYWQWRRWCTKPKSYLPEMGQGLPVADWSRSGAPVSLFAFDDDETIPPKCVARLQDVYGPEKTKCTTVVPSDFGLSKIGHMGAFARASASLWPTLIPQA
ncbi:alpha/beta fold hydrolase [Aliisedimentitalea scapharcae]|uniref:Alpha/beta fold hydrolase n=1 Tax=Aliisedimentitalea scapharcae TaxID=1524259 RepID=A0ABZ2XWP8_9RHOB